MRRWGLIAAAFVTGVAAAVAGFRLAGAAIDCKLAGSSRACAGHPLGEELVYAGLALVAVALLSAVATVGR